MTLTLTRTNWARAVDACQSKKNAPQIRADVMRAFDDDRMDPLPIRFDDEAVGNAVAAVCREARIPMKEEN